jgi:uncharacterized RDD family membrane protein YckC
VSPVVTFETPENIPVSYPLAGPGTRFIAFIFDAFIIFVSIVTLVLILVILALSFGQQAAEAGVGVNMPGAVAAAIATVVMGFIFIAYFGVCEWFMNGATPGKAAMRARVVMADGFSLSFTGVLLRNIFRLIDIIPLLWVVPVVTQREQRFGDMAAGTIVVSEIPLPMHTVRGQLAARPAGDALFVFSPAQSAALTEADVEAMELFFERRDRLHPTHRIQIAERLVQAVALKLDLAQDIFPADRERFLEDLLAAYARKEARDIA